MSKICQHVYRLKLGKLFCVAHVPVKRDIGSGQDLISDMHVQNKKYKNK